MGEVSPGSSFINKFLAVRFLEINNACSACKRNLLSNTTAESTPPDSTAMSANATAAAGEAGRLELNVDIVGQAVPFLLAIVVLEAIWSAVAGVSKGILWWSRP